MDKIKSIIAIGISALLFIACSQGQNPNSTTKATNPVEPAATVPFTKVVLKDDHINEAYKNYISLKNALVASNVAKAKVAAGALSVSLNKIRGCQNTAGIAEKISNSTDIKVQRANFTTLSADFIGLMKHADVVKGTLYVQYCPMANSGNGGYWMASTSEIRNPYYGNEMLNCGEVKEKITKK